MSRPLSTCRPPIIFCAAPDDNLRLVIRETQNNAPLLVASFAGQRRALTSRQLLRAFFQYPLMT